MSELDCLMKNVSSLTVKMWEKHLLERLELEEKVRKPRPGETDEQAQVRFWAVCRTAPAMASIGMSTIIDENTEEVRFEKAGKDGTTLTIIKRRKS